MRTFNLRRAFILSVGLHLMLALVLLFGRFESPVPTHETVTVDFIAPPPDPQKMAAAEEAEKLRQIVEQDKSLNKAKPTKEAYLSAEDQKVEKQTVAKEHGEFANRKQTRHAPAGGGQKPVAEETPVKTEKPKAVAKAHPTLKDFLGESPVAQLQEKHEAEERRKQIAGQGAAGSPGADSSRSNDYLKNVDAGADTMLNTREFRYYTYYARIRRQLSQYWEPKVREKLTKMFKQGRRIASEHDHITKLLIVLNDRGVLVKVQVLNESGVVDLDEAATEAFQAAAPFPNPPKGIVEGDGTVKIRWDFVLES